ncbi:MAG: DUF3291 domain-containing protein [Rhodospirillales bacterium]|nr:DUF3291 domain-containing protein [Rhodospirillales bacterium]
MNDTAWHIVQLNVARAVAPRDSPQLADFMAALDGVNALAEASDGFVWRLKGDSGNATDIKTTDDPNFLVNMSVWTSVEALFGFVYRSAHTNVMARRREWFDKPTEAYQVLWWIPAGHVPTVDEALARLAHLRAHGPSPHAFTFKQRHPTPDRTGAPDDMRPEPYCVGWA